LRFGRRDRHSSGPDITARLGATYPPALRAASTLAYLVLLRVEIARFTSVGQSPTEVLSGSRLRATVRGFRLTPRQLALAPQRPPDGVSPQNSSLLL